eukprot:403367125
MSMCNSSMQFSLSNKNSQNLQNICQSRFSTTSEEDLTKRSKDQYNQQESFSRLQLFQIEGINSHLAPNSCPIIQKQVDQQQKFITDEAARDGQGFVIKQQEPKQLVQNQTPKNIDSKFNEEILAEDSEEDDSSENGSSPSLRTSTKSKVNFSKLAEQEKLTRLQNMANKIKKLKQQIRSLKSYRSKKLMRLRQQQQTLLLNQLPSFHKSHYQLPNSNMAKTTGFSLPRENVFSTSQMNDYNNFNNLSSTTELNNNKNIFETKQDQQYLQQAGGIEKFSFAQPQLSHHQSQPYLQGEQSTLQVKRNNLPHYDHNQLQKQLPYASYTQQQPSIHNNDASIYGICQERLQTNNIDSNSTQQDNTPNHHLIFPSFQKDQRLQKNQLSTITYEGQINLQGGQQFKKNQSNPFKPLPQITLNHPNQQSQSQMLSQRHGFNLGMQNNNQSMITPVQTYSQHQQQLTEGIHK